MNREIVQSGGGAGIYPLTGDVLSSVGSPNVRVIGLQTVSVSQNTPLIGSVLTYNQNANQWQPIVNAVVLMNGLPVSDDFIVTVNFISAQLSIFLVNSSILETIEETTTGPFKLNGSVI